MAAIDEILMIAPLICARMIGITCLAARMQLFRLIATQRSNASSVISSSSASPPARLTPTLLCRMSIYRDHVLGGENAAFQVDRDAAVERLFGDIEQLGIAARQADPDIVVQNVDISGSRAWRRECSFSG